MNRKRAWAVAAVFMTFAVIGGVALPKQDKYAVKLPGGVALSEFRGYEDWELITSAKADDRVKVILGNPTIIAAYKSGVPGNSRQGWYARLRPELPRGREVQGLRLPPVRTAVTEETSC
jgi:hypothetical protein